MIACCDFMALCMIENSVNWIVALIAGCTIFFSILIILLFFMWKIWREHRFDRTIFETFRRTTCSVGGSTQNNSNIQQ